MKRILLPILFFVSSSLVNITALGVLAYPAAAQNVLNGLFSPTSAECYFREGQRQFEREILRLQLDSGTSNPTVLKVDPAIFQQQKNLPQLEQQFLDGVFNLQNPTLPMQSPKGL